MSEFLTKMASAVLRTFGVDANLKFSLDPPPNPSGFDQWRDAMKAVARLPDGMPRQFRQRLWLSLANNFLTTTGVDWDEVRAVVFSDRLNPDDHKLGRQIIKDLHRTGWTGLTGERERSGLKRVLLAYARYNPAVGYCQGFNVIAALILEVMEFNEENAVKVMILLVEKILPTNYFDRHLRALSVDMAVQRQLLRQRLPRLSAHLDRLQKDSVCPYEPPLTNVFAMQWLLTLFATCLPQHTVFRVWDSLLLEGSEILLRTGIAIWSRVGRRIYKAQTADEFYCVMGPVCQDLLQMSTEQSNELLHTIYSMAEFPYPGLAELRERFTWNVQPLSSTFRLFRSQVQQVLGTDPEDSDAVDSFACLANIKTSDRTKGDKAAGEEEKSVDLTALNKQYRHLKQRQEQAAVILQNAYAHGQKRIAANPALSGTNTDGFAVFNHLHFGDIQKKERNVPFSNGIRVSSVAVQPKANSTGPKAKKNLHINELKNGSRISGVGQDRDASICAGGSVVDLTEDSGSLTPTPSRPSLDLLDLNSPTETVWAHQVQLQHHKRRSRSLIVASRTAIRDGTGDRIVAKMRRSWSCADSLLCSRVSEMNTSPFPQNSICKQAAKVEISIFNPSDSTQSNFFTFEVANDQEPTQNFYGTRVAVKRSQTGSKVFHSDVTEAGGQRKTSAPQLSKSKKIIDAAAESARRGQVAPPCRNPFPVAHKTSLIERGKKFGLYC